MTFQSNIPLNHSNKAALLGIGSHLTPKVWLESDPRGGTKHSASIPGRVFCNKRTSLTKSQSPCWCPVRAIGKHTITQSGFLHWQAAAAEAGKSNTHPVTVLSQRRPWHLDMRACVQQHVRVFGLAGACGRAAICRMGERKNCSVEQFERAGCIGWVY